MSYNTPPTNTSPYQTSAPNPHNTFITPNISHAMNHIHTRSSKEDFIYWIHQENPQVYYTNVSNMQHINIRQVPPEARLVRELGLSHHLLRRDSDKRRGVHCPCDPGIYQHQLNCNEKEEEYKIKAGPLGATILRMSTSRILKLMEYDEQLEASIKRMIATVMQENMREFL